MMAEVKTEVHLYACTSCSTVKAIPERLVGMAPCDSMYCHNRGDRVFREILVTTDSDFDSPIHFYAWIAK